MLVWDTTTRQTQPGTKARFYQQFARKSLAIWIKVQHTLGNMLRGREAGRSPFVCAHRTHVAGVVRKLVYTKRMLVYFFVVAGTVCKRSTHDATLKIKVILSLLHDPRIHTS